ncbi:GntR family transcriptional regulator [Arthrobacter gengyunqii]|uniref:GntR family transcriptional regulator n=1 Tax=Arthrobacter gengyunqii TaxID=2886940 RepID=A0A9X1S6C1_9MICC|nr:GntR family transcriptional regulator [Arthrobacter gengyunqii]MCC3266038.1 GntR family transcriptional regulator [Arthrobacter gengyunqii]MCC3268752.1 GntR family transcriptional regulator [Arthrobacter gengyunqii]UOY96136.1 GntR family transcriptional regulator [Arthrobacter gengyunqii]
MSEAGSRIISSIRRAILNGEWVPGGKLQPAALAAQFGTSTTVVREALARLAGDGLVTSERNRGFFVQQLDLRQLRDITELRCVSEGLAAGLSVERGDLQWESDLIAAHHQLSRAPRRAPSDPARITDEWAYAHKQFHAKLLHACDCPPMTKLAADLADSTELYRRWAAPSTAAAVRDVEQEHRDILEAALDRDAAKLAALLRSHYEATVQVVLDAGLVADVAPVGS